ncbi:hypothetical protein BGZ76_004319, partial [Entomortierella beljakovae]
MSLPTIPTTADINFTIIPNTLQRKRRLIQDESEEEDEEDEDINKNNPKELRVSALEPSVSVAPGLSEQLHKLPQPRLTIPPHPPKRGRGRPRKQPREDTATSKQGPSRTGDSTRITQSSNNNTPTPSSHTLRLNSSPYNVPPLHTLVQSHESSSLISNILETPADISCASTHVNHQPDIDLDADETYAAHRALEMRKRFQTVQAYSRPFAGWKKLCEQHSGEYDRDFPYTVGPPEKVIRYFQEFVFQQKYSKYVPINKDVRTQIGIETGESSSSRPSLIDLTEAAPTDKSGKKKVLEIPIGSESVKQHRKALMFLHAFQVEQRSVEWRSPKFCTALKDIIKSYERSLLYDHVQTSQDRGAHCVLGGSYSTGQLITVLKQYWMSGNGLSIREMFCVSARHHMLLRAQDLSNLNFTDCFPTIISQKQHRGSQQVVALTFSSKIGKNLNEGEV